MLRGDEPKEIEKFEKLIPWEKLRLKLTEDEYGLSTRQLFLDQILNPVRDRQYSMELEISISKEHLPLFNKDSSRFLEAKRNLQEIFKEASPTPYLLKPLLVAGGLKQSWNESKFQMKEYLYLVNHEADQLKRLEVLVEKLWKTMDELEKLFPSKIPYIPLTNYKN